jgi:hypothetical protein
LFWWRYGQTGKAFCDFGVLLAAGTRRFYQLLVDVGGDAKVDGDVVFFAGAKKAAKKRKQDCVS